jgi:hypothetical protein
MLTFADLRREVLSWLDESNVSVTSSTYTNVENAIKQAHTIRLTEDNWKFMLWPRFETFSTSGGTRVYSLHQEYLRPYIFRNTTRHVWLVETPSRNIEPSGIDYNQDEDTDRFMLAGRSHVQAQPTSASVVTIVSSSASDTGASKAIVITGDTTDGMTSESITPTGTTPVAGTTSFTQILSVTKSAEWAGTLTMTSNSGAVTNLKLFAAEYGRSYPQIELLYLPSGSETIQYRFYRKPRDLSRDNDLTDIPPPFERVLVFDALLLMGAYDNRLDGGRMALWSRMREDLDFQLRQSQLEGQSLGAEGRFIMERNTGRTMRFPD